MTTTISLAPEPEAPPRSGPQAGGTLRGRIVEMLAIGGGTLLLFPLSWLARAKLGRDAAEDAVDFGAYYLAVAINNPHFAVTYLLFYRRFRQRALGGELGGWQRARYVAAGVVVPLGLAGWAWGALSAGSAQAIGYLAELMFLLVGWHYVKQGFGVLTVLSARRGFRFSAWERRAVLAHCYAGWAYAWANPSSPSKPLLEKGVVFLSIPRPAWLETVALVALGASTLALGFALGRMAWKERRFPPAVPLISFFVTVWLWTIYSSLDPLMMYLIPALHSVQYLYVVALLKRGEARSEEGPPLFGKPFGTRIAALSVGAVALGWVLFRGGPQFLDEAFARGMPRGDGLTTLGKTPYLAAIFVALNIHHYFMDNVIWRREHPEARHLRG
ncbi:MAG: hypothetical protein R3B70_09840 [Polyangiaceae bacterium]